MTTPCSTSSLAYGAGNGEAASVSQPTSALKIFHSFIHRSVESTRRGISRSLGSSTEMRMQQAVSQRIEQRPLRSEVSEVPEAEFSALPNSAEVSAAGSPELPAAEERSLGVPGQPSLGPSAWKRFFAALGSWFAGLWNWLLRKFGR